MHACTTASDGEKKLKYIYSSRLSQHVIKSVYLNTLNIKMTPCEWEKTTACSN